MKRRKRVVRRDRGRARGAVVVEAILARTLEELAEAGLEGLSVARVARRAEVNKTSVYRRWPTRDALVAAALSRVAGDVGSRLPDTGSLRGDLLGLLAPVAALLDGAAGRALLRAALAESSSSAVTSLAGRALVARTKSPVRALAARAQARGEWRRGANGDQLVFALVGALLHRAMLEHGSLSKRWLGSLVDLTVYGVLPRRGAGPTG